MRVELYTKLTEQQVMEVIQKQNKNLHEKEIKPLYYMLTNPKKLGFLKSKIGVAMSKAIPTETKEFLITILETAQENDWGLELITYNQALGIARIELDYPDFFFSLLKQSEEYKKKPLPEKIKQDLARFGIMKKTTDKELKELKKDFSADSGAWIHENDHSEGS